MLSSYRNVFIFTNTVECINLQKGSLRKKKQTYFSLYFYKGVFCVKIFQPIISLANNISQEKFTILNVSYIGFLSYLDSDEILFY